MDDEGQRSSSRKRKRSPGAWKQNKRRKLRNQGEPYVSARGKSIPGKVRGSGCPDGEKCEFKCSENLTEEHREHLFKEFWKLGNFDEQNMYVAGCVTVRPVKRRYTTHGGESRRLFSRVYEFTVPLSADNEDSPLKVRVCKKTFVETLAISASRVDRLLGEKVRNPVRLSDQRGRQKNARKVSEERLHFVREHIKSFPAEESHYSRTENPAAQYLSGDLTLAHMYRLYVQKCTEEEKLPVKESFYRNVFMTEFNLRFKKPRSDTCKTCEELKVKIAATDDETEENNLKRDLELHHRKAEAARKAMDADSQVASVEEDSMCLCFDLQQTLDTPKLPVGEAFYLRQLNTYNLAVVNNVTLEATMFVWNESEGKRGADEVASCLLKYLKTVSGSVKRLVLWSDGCGGQNKNHQLQLLWMYLVQSHRFLSIEHKFPEVGHTYLPCDRCFGHIEQKKRKTDYVYTTDEWVKLISQSRPKKRFQVVRLKQDDFVNIDGSLKRFVCVRKKTNNGRPVRFQKVMAFRHSHDKPFEISLRYSHGTLQGESVVSYQIRRRRGQMPLCSLDMGAAPIGKKYTSVLPIRKAKYDDLQKMLKFIPPSVQHFYTNLKAMTSREESDMTTEDRDDALGGEDSGSESD